MLHLGRLGLVEGIGQVDGLGVAKVVDANDGRPEAGNGPSVFEDFVGERGKGDNEDSNDGEEGLVFGARRPNWTAFRTENSALFKSDAGYDVATIRGTS
jgi:hypothetical protein